jgi:hypothetical protein
MVSFPVVFRELAIVRKPLLINKDGIFRRDSSYEQACIALHEAMEEVESGQRQGQSRENRDSPVALAIERLRGKREKS